MRRGLFASIIGVIALVGCVTNASASTNPAPLRYVALGDSYSAGSGVLPPDLKAPRSSACARAATSHTSSPSRWART